MDGYAVLVLVNAWRLLAENEPLTISNFRLADDASRISWFQLTHLVRAV